MRRNRTRTNQKQTAETPVPDPTRQNNSMVGARDSGEERNRREARERMASRQGAGFSARQLVLSTKPNARKIGGKIERMGHS